MPVYNAAKYVGEAIQSIVTQSFQDFELLIVDDASKDQSLEIIQSFSDKRVRIFKNEENLGYLSSCNFLFEQAQGQWIGFQDADDISNSSRIQAQMDYLDKNFDVVLCGTQAWYFHTDWRKPVRYKNVATSSEDILKGLHLNNQFCGASVIVKKDAIKEVGYYQKFFERIGNEDYDCFFRIAQKYKVANLSEYLYFVRLTPNSITRVIRSPLQYISGDIVKFLAIQRSENQCDSLTGLDANLLDNLIQAKLLPFKRDSSLLSRKNADLAAYNKNYSRLLVHCFQAVKARPFLFINWKYFIAACLRTPVSAFFKSL